MMSSRLARAALALAVLASASCGGGSVADTATCPASYEKSSLLQTAQSWYLYQDLVPGTTAYQQLVSTPFDAGAAPSAQALLDGFTAAARAKAEDRYWSYLITQQQAQQYFQAGQSAGYGIGLLITGATGSERLFVSQVMRGSPAAQAGFARGDEILALGSTAGGVVPVQPLIAGGTLGAAISGATTGTVKYLTVVPRGAAASVPRSMTSAVYDLDPVVATTVTSPGGKPVGYVLLRTFVATAEDKLRAAFASFKQAGVADVVVDVRYDGGGLLQTAQVLASLLHPNAGEVMYSGTYNAQHASEGWSESFAGEADRLAAVGRVAFISTGGTASASELVPNALAPYLGANLAVVGDRSYGKPVGQRAFDLGSCQDELYLISFRLVNRDGYGGYYDGLPSAGFAGGSCAAADDLTRDLGDPAESSTAQALAFIDQGAAACTAIPPATAAPTALRAAAPGRAVAFPRPERPTPAQVEMPGLF